MYLKYTNIFLRKLFLLKNEFVLSIVGNNQPFSKSSMSFFLIGSTTGESAETIRSSVFL